jgi:ATP-dependent Clp protease ATP-binding subunit ClpA
MSDPERLASHDIMRDSMRLILAVVTEEFHLGQRGHKASNSERETLASLEAELRELIVGDAHVLTELLAFVFASVSMWGLNADRDPLELIREIGDAMAEDEARGEG